MDKQIQKLTGAYWKGRETAQAITVGSTFKSAAAAAQDAGYTGDDDAAMERRSFSIAHRGSTSLDIRGQFGPRVEIQGYSFIESPIEYRFCRNDKPICDWRQGDNEFHDLQRGALSWWMERGTGFLYNDPNPAHQPGHVTFGLSPIGLTIETCGLVGNPSVWIELRPGTYPETGHCGGD